MTYDLRSNRYFVKAVKGALLGSKVVGYGFLALLWEGVHVCLTLAWCLPMIHADADVSQMYHLAGSLAIVTLALHLVTGLWPFRWLYR